MPVPDEKRSREILGLDKVDCSILLRFISGHNHCNYHNHIIDRDVDPTCRLCHGLNGAVESSVHLIDCPALLQHRKQWWRNGKCPSNWRVKDLLDYIKLPEIRALEDSFETEGETTGDPPN